MTQALLVPVPALAAKVFTGCVGRQVNVTLVEPMDVTASAPRLFGAYCDADETMRVVCVCDTALAAAASGTMMGFPKAAIDEAAKTGRLNDMLLDASREILNILAQAFYKISHQVLRHVSESYAELPHEYQPVIKTPGLRFDFSLLITGFPQGRMSVFAKEAA